MCIRDSDGVVVIQSSHLIVHCWSAARRYLNVYAGREQLLQDASVLPSLQAVAEHGLCSEARQHASAALVALSDKQMTQDTDIRQKHVMLSYQWAYQAIILRTNESLIARGYATWFDLTNMKGEPISWNRSVCVLRASVLLKSCARVRMLNRRPYVDRQHDGRDERCDRGG